MIEKNFLLLQFYVENSNFIIILHKMFFATVLLRFVPKISPLPKKSLRNFIATAYAGIEFQ